MIDNIPLRHKIIEKVLSIHLDKSIYSPLVRKNDKKVTRVEEFINNPNKAVWKLAMPVMLGMAVQTVYSIADMIFVGWIGGDAIAALTFNVPLIFLAFGVVAGLGSGTTALIAQYLGAKNKKSANVTAEQSVMLGVIMSIVITTVGVIFRYDIFRILGTPENIIHYATSYFTIIAYGFVFNILSVFFRSIMTGEGDTRTPIIFMVVGTVLNIILDPIFIRVLDWEIAGAAWATVLSQFIVFLLFVHFMFIRRGTYVQMGFRRFRFNKDILMKIFNVGIPASTSMVIMSVGGIVFNWLLSSFGSDGVAGYGIGGRIDQIFFMPNFALASSLVTLSGMFYGAKRLDLVRSTWYYTLKQGLYIAFGSGIFFYFTAPALLKIFTQEQAILGYGLGYIRILVFAFPFITVGMISGRVFQGFGEGMPGLIITTLRVLLISAPLSYVFIHILHLDITYIWLSILAGAMSSAVIAFTWLSTRIQFFENRFHQQS